MAPPMAGDSPLLLGSLPLFRDTSFQVEGSDSGSVSGASPLQSSPTFLEPGTGFLEESFSMDRAVVGGCQDDSSVLRLLRTLLLCGCISSTSDHQALDHGG